MSDLPVGLGRAPMLRVVPAPDPGEDADPWIPSHYDDGAPMVAALSAGGSACFRGGGRPRECARCGQMIDTRVVSMADHQAMPRCAAEARRKKELEKWLLRAEAARLAREAERAQFEARAGLRDGERLAESQLRGQTLHFAPLIEHERRAAAAKGAHDG